MTNTNTLATITDAASDVIEQHGKPGASARYEALARALTTGAEEDQALAVVIAAARWTDRYGSSGAGDRLSALSAAVARHTMDDAGRAVADALTALRADGVR